MRPRYLAVVLLGIVALSACGKKGNLVLPPPAASAASVILP